jgi:hypothetical protein
MTDENSSLADQIANSIAQKAPNAVVKIDPIPQHIASNLLEFLRRVQCTGMEAVAWCEAYQFVQQHAPQQQPQGVPFTGLPGQQKK